MKRAKYDLRLTPENALERAVVRLLRDGASDSLRDHVRDVLTHGCQSGVVGGLISYRDTCRFYQRHIDQILRTLQDALDDMGNTSPAELFGTSWDASDMFAREEQNQNLLAWWAMEETARALASRAGFDV